jgi:hypothetical protein
MMFPSRLRRPNTDRARHSYVTEPVSPAGTAFRLRINPSGAAASPTRMRRNA